VVWLDASAAGKFRRAVERLTCRRGNCSSSLKSSLSLSLSLAAFFLSFSLLPKSVSSSFCLVYSSTHIVSFCCCFSRSLFRSLEGTTSQLWNLLSLQSCSRSPPNLSLSLTRPGGAPGQYYHNVFVLGGVGCQVSYLPRLKPSSGLIKLEIVLKLSPLSLSLSLCSISHLTDGTVQISTVFFHRVLLSLAERCCCQLTVEASKQAQAQECDKKLLVHTHDSSARN
jgi:hypothetical protein